MGFFDKLKEQREERRQEKRLARTNDRRAEVLRQAAESGDPQAQYDLGRSLIQSSQRGQEAYREGLAWRNRAAQGGHPDALLELGTAQVNRALDDGLTSTQTAEALQTALDYYVRAAQAGSGEAALRCGGFYSGQYEDFPADRAKALMWYQQAITLGMDKDSLLLDTARLLDQGGDGITIDRARAFDLYWRIYQRAVDTKVWHKRETYIRPALLRCGELLLTGDGVEKDPQKAFQCFQRLADSLETFSDALKDADAPAFLQRDLYQIAQASYYCAAMLHLGQDIPQDEAKAAHYLAQAKELFPRAAQSGSTEAQRFLSEHNL